MSETTTDNNFDFPFPNFFSQFTSQSAERLESFVDEWEKWEQRGADQAEKAVEQTAHLMRATLDYSLQLQSELRKQTIDNTRKTLEMFGNQEQSQ